MMNNSFFLFFFVSEGSSLPQLYEDGPSLQTESSSSGAAVCMDEAALACVSVDMELDTDEEEPELMNNTAVTQQQAANITSAVVHPLQ